MLRRTSVLLFAGILAGLSGVLQTDTSGGQDKPSSPKQEVRVTFRDDITPILKQNCTPCHFKGGKLYEKLPFDKYETVRALGKKLNTRLKGQNAELVIRWIKDGFPEKPIVKKNMQ